MRNLINERIRLLRETFSPNHISAFIIPSTDPHLSEYVAPHWQSREWISGFTGSAGTVVITREKAGLWTDSRYFLQAAEQIEGTEYTLYREMLPGTPSINEFISNELRPGEAVGIDGKMFSAEQVMQLETYLRSQNIRVELCKDPMDDIWNDRPPLPNTPAFIYDLKYAGKDCDEKIAAIRGEMKKQKAESFFLSSLDEIAWALNLRGQDIHCNPVVISYLLITQNEIIFFIDPQKLTKEVGEYLHKHHITVKDYAETERYLSTLKAANILLNPAKTNFAAYAAINSDCRIICHNSPVTLMKALRNEQEIAGIHAAMKRDGVALVRFLIWLEKAVPTGKESELSIDKKLHELRAEQDLYMGESFDTIAGYKGHAAIVHYEATQETNARLLPKGFLLLDSGAQYLDGTTDITRTIALGELTEEEKTDYTLVLKGHIALAKAIFPVGTRGTQLDVLAHMPLWQHKLNYLHGTGHGVGHFLSVHEGPQSIRTNENPTTLRPGMVTSNEPGVYRGGSHGVRTENLTLVRNAGAGMYGDYLEFETITLCPIDKKGILPEMLTLEEKDWLNEYHKKVYDTLSPELNEEEKQWLQEATSPITNE